MAFLIQINSIKNPEAEILANKLTAKGVTTDI
jgi:hypothetical protein